MRAVASRQSAKGPIWQVVLVYALLMLFSTQSILTQSHLHPSTSNPIAGLGWNFDSGLKLTISGPLQEKFPTTDDKSNCTLCQAAAVAGHFVAPGVIAAVLVANFVHAPPGLGESPFIRARVSHDWRGRGPPNI